MLSRLAKLAIATSVYIFGFAVAVGVFLLFDAGGIDGGTSSFLPYFLVFAFVYGLCLGWWWTLLVPGAQWTVVAIAGSSGGTLTYDPGAFIIAGTLATATGVLVRRHYARADG